MYQKFEQLPDAKLAIMKGFVELYSKKPYESISVKELCAVSHVARTTFYFHYQNIGELKQDIENLLIDGLLTMSDEAAKGDYTTIDFLQWTLNTIAYLEDNREFIMAFLVTQPSYTFRKRWEKEIKNHIKMEFPKIQNAPNWELTLEIQANMVLTAYAFWLENPDKIDWELAQHDYHYLQSTLLEQKLKK